jgi:hypothetical protein
VGTISNTVIYTTKLSRGSWGYGGDLKPKITLCNIHNLNKRIYGKKPLINILILYVLKQ